jgi:ribosomal protein S21
VQSQHLEVKVYNNNFDKAMTAFRTLVQKERILSLYKEKQNFEKPSDKKRRKRNEMKRKIMELDFKGDHKESKYKKKKSPEQSR